MKDVDFPIIAARSDGVTQPHVVYRGADAAEKFLKELQEEQKHVKNLLDYPEPMKMVSLIIIVGHVKTICVPNYLMRLKRIGVKLGIIVTSGESTEVKYKTRVL